MADNYGVLRKFLSEEQIQNLPNQLKGQSWAFEPHLRMINEDVQNNLDNKLDDLCVAWMATFDKRMPSVKTQQHFIDVANVIMANLLRAYCKHKDMLVGIGRRKGRLDRERRYRPEYMTTNRFITVQDWLIKFGLMRIEQKGYNFAGEGQTTRVLITDEAARDLEVDDLTLRDFRIGKPDEAILLKNSDGQLSAYEDTDETNAMRLNLDRINELLCKTDISTSRALTLHDRKPDFIGGKINLHRQFHYGDFQTGGRFYGGWWQYIRKYARRLITLDGVPTVEADYRGFNAAVLLAKAGHPIPDDPYSLIAGVSQSRELRGHAKTTLAALLNSKSGNTEEPRNFDEDKHGMTADAFRQSVYDAFPMLQGLLGQNTGMKLQRDESDLAELVMLHFVDQGFPILPIHDAFMVQEHLQDELVQVMKDVFLSKHGQTPHVKITLPLYVGKS
ncbi:hypothetical protein SAMN04488515_1901 [Cognatiyoonia koreensis]|uniref:Uncharacterized protein n=1 Tax=Cognatiyoonia koreensis TaxID=364200 RepID=A0A1I0QGK1_9RHOB|nr:hypothetical protein [Cognatiyoonia koreensis]SEW26098.1 hypothetical protein SAMN04488515_1901 [Cognatiyoonia koreensis]